MLPSKGYFSALPCPFYDAGDCIRPHCHFRHSKKDKHVDSKTANAADPCEETGKESNKNVERIKELVTETVKQVLSQTDLGKKTDNGKLTDDIVNDVVSSIEPKLDSQKKEFPEVPSYKPTPISELNKRHIPVVYAPTKPDCIDRVKRKEYMPRSLNKNALLSRNAYVPTSTINNRSDSSYQTDTYTYQPSQICNKPSTKEFKQINFLCHDSTNNSSNEEKLRALDQLIEEEFGSTNDVVTSHKCEERGTFSVSSNITVSTTETTTPITVTTATSTTATATITTNTSVTTPSSEPIQKTVKEASGNKVSAQLEPVASSKKTDKKKFTDNTTTSSLEESKKKDEHTHSTKNSLSKSKTSSKEAHLSSKEEDKTKHKHKKHDDHKHSKSSSSSSGCKDKKNKDKEQKHDNKKSRHSSDHKKSTSMKCDKNRKDFEDVKKKDKHEKSSSHHKVCTKDQKQRHKSSKKNLDIDEPPPSKKIKKEFTKVDLNVNDSTSSSSDVEEIINYEDAIVIDSSSNSSRSSVNESLFSDQTEFSPPPEKKKREQDFKVSFSSPQTVLAERWRRARETVSLKTSMPGKLKIAQVRNVSSLLHAKDELIAKAKKVPDACLPSVPIVHEEYVPKPVSRKAHTPSEALAKYPVVIMHETLKVPVQVRQACLNNIYDEYAKFCEPQIARERAQSDEFGICRRLHVTKTYQNAVALALLRIRKTRGAPSNHESVQETVSVLHSNSVPGYTYGWTLYKCFAKYIISEQEYITNGYPIQLASRKDCAYIEKSARRSSIKQPEDISMRICINCSKNYGVNEEGFPLEENNCFYHWGKLRRIRGILGISEIYICCGGDIGSEPCYSARYHVCNLYNEDLLEGFVSTRPMKPGDSEDKAGIYAVDCEMCYTTKGLALARCTFVDLNGKRVYDQIVAPEDPILDYCTRFSGMTESIMKGAKLRLKDVQRDILRMVNEKTILIGHSLENDLKVLRIFHKTVVDTSLVFPHQMGPPRKKGLKVIAKEILNTSIQDNESGHDSYEDANACMQIMFSKIKEDAKERKPRVIISLDSKGVPKIKR